MNGDVNGKEKKWLVKSSTRILGPFSVAEIADLLRTRQVSIIDEIRQTEGRWSYIREIPMFMEIVQSIRKEQDANGDETMTESLAQHTMTKTDAIVGEDFTQTPTPVMRNFENTPTPPLHRDTGLKDVTPLVETPSTKGAASSAKARSYGASEDSRVQNQLRQKSQTWRWMILAATAVIIAGVAITLSQKDKRKNVSFEELVAQAIRYKNLGLYEKSLQSYSRATKIREPDLDTQVQMAPLLISEDRQSLAGRRILERNLIQEKQSRNEIVESYLGIAVSYMMDGDLKQAEDVLQKALGYEPFNISALLNMSIIQQKKGNYSEASKGFAEILRKNPRSTLALYGKVLASLELAKLRQDYSELQTLSADLQQQTQKEGYLRQELLLLLTYSNALQGDVNGLNQAVTRFLSQMIGQAKNYGHPLNVDWRFTQWDHLGKYCSEIFEKSSPNPELKAFRAVCLMETNRDSEAGKMLQEALAESPKDPYVLATQVGYLNRVGRLPEARAILKMPELATLPIKNAYLGDICISTQDTACAKQAYTDLNASDKNSVLSLYGLAWVAMKNQDRTKAYEFVRTGLQAEANFLPLLDLRDQLESQ